MPPRARGAAGQGPRGRGAAPARGGPALRGGPARGGAPTPGLPAAHVTAVGIKRTSFGRAGRPINILTNHFAVTEPSGTVRHYDGKEPWYLATCLLVEDDSNFRSW
jgi:eukaryotic translation initiation factor 2C